MPTAKLYALKNKRKAIGHQEGKWSVRAILAWPNCSRNRDANRRKFTLSETKWRSQRAPGVAKDRAADS